jgi:hypothetical protein
VYGRYHSFYTRDKLSRRNLSQSSLASHDRGRSSVKNLPSDEQHMKRLFLEAVAFSFSLQEKLLYAAGFYSNEE